VRVPLSTFDLLWPKCTASSLRKDSWKIHTRLATRSSDPVGSIYLFGSKPALDLFIVSVSNNIKTLCETQQFHTYNEIETLTINHENLTIEMIFALACTVSTHCPTYNLYRNQCYWYASVIWEILIDLAKAGCEANVTYSKSDKLQKGTNTFFLLMTRINRLRCGSSTIKNGILFILRWNHDVE
jgi:hypothetical protein